MGKFRVICDVAGLAVVVVGTGVVVWVLVSFDVLNDPWVAGLIAAPTLIGTTLYTWYASKAGQDFDTEKWMAGTLSTPLLGAVFFAIDVFIGSTHGHYANFVQAAFRAGSPFGILLTMLVCPIGTIICAGSWMRSALLDRLFPKPEID